MIKLQVIVCGVKSIKKKNYDNGVIQRKRLMKKRSYPHKTINGVKKRMHIHVMEEQLGRELEKNEHVYHINGDQNDYSIENLVIIRKKLNDR